MDFFRSKKSFICKWDIGYNTRGFFAHFPVKLMEKGVEGVI